MGIWKNLFTWWEGAGLTTLLFTRRQGAKVGSDAVGNSYYTSKDGARRWVIYNGSNDTSRIPPEWYSWMIGQIDGPPDEALPPARPFQRPPTPNLTGTAEAYRPSGSLERGGRRQASGGDYQAWTPD